MKPIALFSCIFLYSNFISAQESDRRVGIAVVNPVFRSEHRQTMDLNGIWDFATDPDKVGDNQKWYATDAVWTNKTILKVPGCWEAQGIGGKGMSFSVTPEFSSRPLIGTYRGAGWYRKVFTVPANWNGPKVRLNRNSFKSLDSSNWNGTKIWLKIGGVHAQGWFWVNGTYVGHDDSYCGAYKYDITDLVKPGERCVVVVKARNDVPSGKGLVSWVERFGGLYRGVEIESTSTMLIDDFWAVGDLDRSKVDFRIQLRNMLEEVGNSQDMTVRVVVKSIRDNKVVSDSKFPIIAPFLNRTNETSLIVPIDSIRGWYPDDPFLYRASVELIASGKIIDGWEERFGIKKWEVRGGQFYLNSKPFFVRGYGDDYIYPETLCSPASLEYHSAHLKKARDFGFVYVRHHTHCEVPEFFDAADEAGIMVQPELPYYGSVPSARTNKFFRPFEDAKELYLHYRRYVSFATYCTGNEGTMGSALSDSLYKFIKRMDITRLVIHQDGGDNTMKNSDFLSGPSDLWSFNGTNIKDAGGIIADKSGIIHRIYTGKDYPFVCHEYLNLATEEDPRLESKYTKALGPPVTAADFNAELKRNNLSWDSGIACIDAGSQLQRYSQKHGLERARKDLWADGYSFWTLVDVGNPAAQGLFNQFWETKKSTATDFHQFNKATALLVNCNIEQPVLSAGEVRKVEWIISHYGMEPLRNSRMIWSLRVKGKEVGKGMIDAINVNIGERALLGNTLFTAPSVQHPEKLVLTGKIENTDITNSWEFWVFPRVTNSPAGANLAACEKLLPKLKRLFPQIVSVDSKEGKSRAILLTDTLRENQTVEFLTKGKKVFLMELRGPKPPIKLDWWGMGDQRGTALLTHKAFGDFPHDGFMGPQMFRLVGSTILMSNPENQSIEPLMTGKGNDGYLTYVFQAKVLNGRLFGSGLNLLSGTPESVCLLNNFVRYIQSDDFKPVSVWDIK